MKLLVIARHHSPSMHRKVELLQSAHGWSIHYVIPLRWSDALTAETATAPPNVAHRRFSFIGSADDPHRAAWRTVEFGMREFNPDIILAEEEPDSIAALQVAITRSIFAPHAKLVLYTWQNVARPLSIPASVVRRHNLRQADGIICANTAAQRLLTSLGFSGPVALAPSIGVDPDAFYPCDKGPLTQPAKPLRVGYAGRLLKEKGVEILLEAITQIPHFLVEAHIIGSGPHAEALRAKVAELGLQSRVTFVPSVPPAIMRSALCELDALVLPSLSTPYWEEQFGRVIVEAMACGIPVIGSSSGAIPEVIGDAGIVVPENSPKALAGAIADLAHSIDTRLELRARGIKRVASRYTQTEVARTYSEFLTRVCRT